ncbi:hypothetical protein [Dyella sp. 2RAB6]|uniref:hypothetical protein n=1 Tax=Dyella sp. 2RAB6 TaxID=3232992 RepID=UPI003F905337
MGMLLGVARPAGAGDPTIGNDQAVIVHFKYGTSDLKPLFALEDKLESTIKSAGVGVLDGDELATDGRDSYIYMYGHSADRLFDAVKPVLSTSPLMKGARVAKRYGPPGETTRQVVIVLGQ